MSEIAGIYHYHRIGHDEREMELCPDGTIGIGAGAGERRWELRSIDHEQQLSILGDHGEICRLRLESDGCWRGPWLQFERMLVELIPQRGALRAGLPVLCEGLPAPHTDATAGLPYSAAIADIPHQQPHSVTLDSGDSSPLQHGEDPSLTLRVTSTSVALVSGYSANWDGIGRLTMPSRREYAARHGYDCHVFEDEAFCLDRPAAWSKLRFLEELLDRYEWLWWLDADAVITNPSVPVDQFLGSGNAQMIIGQDWNGINTGSFFLHRGTWAREFLREAWNQTDLIYHGWWEQAAMMRLMNQSAYRDRIDIQPHWRFNGYPEGPTRTWRQGDFVIHFASCPDRERRIEQFLRSQEGSATVSPSSANSANSHPNGDVADTASQKTSKQWHDDEGRIEQFLDDVPQCRESQSRGHSPSASPESSGRHTECACYFPRPGAARASPSPLTVAAVPPRSYGLRALLSLCHDFGELSGWWGMTLPAIYGIVVGCRAKSMLEVGVHKGASTRALLLAAEINDGYLISIDLEDCSAVVPAELRPRWVFRQGDSRSVVPFLTGPFDFALIDGEHTREAVEMELHYLNDLISPGGTIFLDDCFDTWQGVLDAFLAFESARPHEKTLVPYGQPESLEGTKRTFGLIRFLDRRVN